MGYITIENISEAAIAVVTSEDGKVQDEMDVVHLGPGETARLPNDSHRRVEVSSTALGSLFNAWNKGIIEEVEESLTFGVN